MICLFSILVKRFFTARTVYSLNFDARRPEHPGLGRGQLPQRSLMQGVRDALKYNL